MAGGVSFALASDQVGAGEDRPAAHVQDDAAVVVRKRLAGDAVAAELVAGHSSDAEGAGDFGADLADRGPGAEQPQLGVGPERQQPAAQASPASRVSTKLFVQYNHLCIRLYS